MAKSLILVYFPMTLIVALIFQSAVAQLHQEVISGAGILINVLHQKLLQKLDKEVGVQLIAVIWKLVQKG